MKFRLVLGLDWAAFHQSEGTQSEGTKFFETVDGSEIARILRDVADRVGGKIIRYGDGSRLRDINSNYVGEWEIADK